MLAPHFFGKEYCMATLTIELPDELIMALNKQQISTQFIDGLYNG